MKDKISQVCDYILNRIESGEYREGAAIPAARKLTQEVGASFAIVQHAASGAPALPGVSQRDVRTAADPLHSAAPG